MAVNYGIKIEVDDGASSAYVSFMTRAVSLPKLSIQFANGDYLNMSSRIIPKEVGLTDPGELTFTAKYSKTDLDRYYDLVGDNHNWKITWEDGSTAVVAGIANYPSGDFSDGSAITEFQGVVQVNGDVTFTAGA